MANLPISGLTAGVAIQDADLFADVQSPTVGPMKVTALQIKTYIGNGLTLTGAIIQNPVIFNGVSYTFPASNGPVGSVLTNNGSGALTWTASASGTVTSVDASGGATGLTFTGGPVISSGTLVLGGALNVASGGTGATTAAGALVNLLPTMSGGTAGYALFNDGAGNTYWAAAGGGGGGGGGSVTSVATTVGGLTVINPTGAAVLSGTVSISGGGTGATTISGAQANLLPNQAGQVNRFLMTNGAGVLSWQVAGGAGGGVSTVGTTLSGITVTNPTTTPSIGGTLGVTSGGTGKNTAPANGQLLIGNSSGGYSLATLTQGTGVTITNASGAITISSSLTSVVSSFSAGATGFLPNSATTGAVTLTGKLNIASGGTNMSTVGAAGTSLISNGTALVYGYPTAGSNLVGGTAGQVPYQSAPSTTAFSGPGAAGTYLAGNGTLAPTWNAASLTLGTTTVSLGATALTLAGLTSVTVTQGPTNPLDLATKAYVDANSAPLNRLAPVDLATTPTDGNQTLSGPATIDSTPVVDGMRILVKDQTNMATAGVYIVNTGGSWIRATDLDTDPEFTAASAFVLGGTQNINTSWIQTVANVIVNTTPQAWTIQAGLNAYTGGTGISITGGTVINNTGVLSWAGGSTGLTPVSATTGAVTLAGTLNISNGGTSATTAVGARTNILPTQAAQAGKFLQSNGTDVLWASVNAGGPTTFIPVNLTGTIVSKISGAGVTDAVSNSYVFYNSTTAPISLNATSIPNSSSFTNCTPTTIYIGANKTMMVTTQVVGSTYFIDASNFESNSIYFTSITTSSTMSSILTSLSVVDEKYNYYAVQNTSTIPVTISGLTVDNPNAFPGFTTASTIVIPAGGEAYFQTSVSTTNYLVLNISNSVATNLSGGAAGKIPYQTAANTTAFTAVGVAGQLLQSNGAAAPTWVNPSSGAVFRSISAGGLISTLLGVTDKVGSINTFYNSSSSAITLTGTIDNTLSWSEVSTAGTITLGPKESVTIATDVVGTNYSIIAASEANEIAGADVTTGGTITSVLNAAGLTEAVGSLYNLRNTSGGTLTITASQIDGFEPYAPAASGTSIILAHGESVTLLVQVVSSQYQIITMSSPAISYVSASANVTTSTFLADGAVGNNGVMIYNSGTTSITVTAAAFSNNLSYTNYCTGTVFTLAPKATVSIVLDGVASDTWQILSYSSAGSPIKYISLPATTPVSVATALTTATITDAVGSEYVFYNNNNTAVVLTATFDNAASYPANVATTNLTVAPKQTVTLVTTTVGTNYSIVSISSDAAPKMIGYANATSYSGGATIAAILSGLGITQAAGVLLTVVNDDTVAWPLKTSTANDTFNNKSPLYVDQVSGATPQLSLPVGATATVEVVTVDPVGGNVYAIVSIARKAAQQFNITADTNLKDYLANNALYIGDVITITNTDSASHTITAESFVNGSSYSSAYTPTAGANTFAVVPNASVTLSLISAASTAVNGTWAVVSYSYLAVSGSGAGTVAFSSVSTGATAVGTVATYPAQVVKMPAGAFNVGNYYNSTTGKFQPLVAGYYQVNAGVTTSGSANNAVNLSMFKNGAITNFVPSFSTASAGSSALSGIVYLNGSSDYLELGAYATTGYTPSSQNLYFNGALINQQTVTTNASSGNFMLSTAVASQTMTALLAGQTPPITDLKNNIYVINNTSTTTPAVITATGFSGYQSWPQQATATSITIPANGYAEIMTTSAGTGYQIITISSSNINANSPVAFTAIGGGAVTLNSTSVYPASVVKFASVTFDNSSSYNTSTGKFQPTSAGYYQISSGVNTSGFPNNGLTWLLYKNGVQTITAWDSATSIANTATIATVVYLNGTTDYIEIVSNTLSGTFTPNTTAMWFSGILINQQKVISAATSSTFNISTASSGNIPALIGAQTSPAITDVKDNVYVINNSGASTITLTATGISGYQAWPTQATATSLIIPAGGYAEIITTSAGSGYQIIFMSAPFVSGSVAFSAFGPTPGVNVGTSSAYPASKIVLGNAQFNPQSYYDTATGRFNPKIAGYYQVNAYIYNSGSVDYLWLLLYKNGVQEQNQAATNTGGYGTGVQLAKLVYLNGTTDYLEIGAYYGSTGAGTVAPVYDGSTKFTASLVTQQRVTSASGVNNYILSSATSIAMPALIASASPVITDIIGNVYAISNSGGSSITISATGFSGYTAYAAYANATTMTLPVGASAVVMTTAAGSGYQIMSMSVPASAVSTTPATFAIGNAAGTSFTQGQSSTANGFTYNTIQTYTTPDPVSYLNPQNYYSNTTGKFQPLVAGYYQFTGRVSGLASTAQYVAVIKNAFEVTPATVGWDLNQGQVQSAECNGVVYMNGTTDYLVLAFRTAGGGYTITGEALSCYFSAIAVNNQVVNAGSASTNYNLSTSVASQTVAALLAAQSPVITDVKNNVYVINNSGGSPITLTGTYSGYQAFPLSATSSAITLAVGATAEIMTTVVGTGYQIITISSPVGTVTPTNVAFNVTNANNTTTIVSGGTIVDTVNGFTYYYTKIPTVDPGSYLNPQTAYNVSTGKFQPTVAGYYQINAGFNAANGYAFIAIIKNQTTWVSTGLGVGAGDGAETSGVVFMNGTTDYVQMAICNSNSSTITSRTGPSSAYFNGVLTTQQAVYTTTGANMNFAISASTSDTIPNLIAAQTSPTITDIKNNVYVINNTGGGQIILSATALSGYQAFPLNSTATTITLDVGCTAEIMTTSAGTSYQIVTISTPVATASTTSVVCNVGNANASQPTMLPGTIVIGADTFNFLTIGTTNVTSLLNPLNVYNTTTGKFQPTVAGYYQINGCVSINNASYLYVALVKNGTIPLANSINGGGLAMAPNAVVFLNGTTDYVQLAFSTNSNAGTAFRDRTDINYFSAALLTQQSVYVENGIKNNYNIGTSTASQTITALLAAQSPAITDVLDNVYIISNSGATPIDLTATNFTGWESYSTNASATTITLPPAGFVALTTTIAGTSYQIFSMSQSFAAGSVAFRGATSASYTNNGLTAGAVLATVTGAALRTMLFTSEAATINPQAWYDPATGKYTPKVAGFYEVNFRYMFRNNSTTGTSGYIGLFKNGSVYSIAFDDTAPYCCPEIGAVVFMNGATDYLQVGASVNVGTTTLLIADGSQEWDISLSNQQTIQYANNGLSGNYSFFQNSTTSISALIALNGVTDVLYNQYCIYNDGGADIALSDFFLGWEGFSGNATSTIVTLPAGATLTIITIAAGGSYQIVNISLPYTAGSVAFKVKDTFAYTISGMKTVDNYDTVSFNQPAWLDPVTGSFTPQIAGYYLLSAEITKSTDGYLSSRFLFNGTDASQSVTGDNTGSGDPQSVTLSEVFYFNGTSDYAQVQVSAGTNQNVLVTYSGLLTNQVANNGQAASVRYAGARGDMTGTTSDVAVATLDNLRFGWYGTAGSCRMWVQAVSGTASLWGGWTLINDSGGADFYSANYDQTSAGFTTPLIVTTAKQYFTSGSFSTRVSTWAIFQDSVSGNTYRVTFYLGDAYKGMQTNIERLN